jgi:hypothetical protein
VGLEAACWEVALVLELPGVGYPLIDQDQAGPILIEELAQDITRAGRNSVVGLDAGEGLLAAELQASSPTGYARPSNAIGGKDCQGILLPTRTPCGLWHG